MTAIEARRCAACNTDRSLVEFLVVTTTATGTVYFVCRPGLTIAGVRGQTCFRAVVPTADKASIALALDPREATR